MDADSLLIVYVWRPTLKKLIFLLGSFALFLIKPALAKGTRWLIDGRPQRLSSVEEESLSVYVFWFVEIVLTVGVVVFCGYQLTKHIRHWSRVRADARRRGAESQLLALEAEEREQRMVQEVRSCSGARVPQKKPQAADNRPWEERHHDESEADRMRVLLPYYRRAEDGS